MRRRLVSRLTYPNMMGTITVLVVLGAGTAPASASAKSFHGKVTSAAEARQAAKQDPNRGTLSAAARRAIHRGYLVPNQARYDRQKARSTRHAASREALTAPVSGPLAPSIVSGRSFQGINNPNVAPPDETSAVGTTRYIELVNTNFAIYNKTSNSPISTGTINSLAGAASTDSVFDVQVIWDPTTSRFYYAADDVVSSSDNRVAFGFSKTASPSSAADFCKYSIGFGTVFPDYPKLGDSQFFAMIGSNLFSGSNSFLGSDLLAISKPPSGTSCPAASSFKLDDAAPLLINATTQAFTPVPANEIDTKATGFAVARPAPLPATQLSLFKVTRDATTGNPVIQSTGTPVTVPKYMWPSNAPQKGSVNALDTLDARNTQSVAGVDPGHGGKFAIWTQHSITVGGRAAIRWYEIGAAAQQPAAERDGIEPLAVPVQRRDLAEPASQRHHEGGRRRDGLELRQLIERRVPADQDGLQGRSRRAIRSGRGQELAGAAVRVRLRFGDPVLPLGRLRRRDPRPVNCEPDLAGQPVRRRLGKRHHRPGDLEDPELRRHSVA